MSLKFAGNRLAVHFEFKTYTRFTFRVNFNSISQKSTLLYINFNVLLMLIEYNEKEMYYMEEKIDVKFYSHISYVLACIELYLRKCNRANTAKSRPDIAPAETFLFPGM